MPTTTIGTETTTTTTANAHIKEIRRGSSDTCLSRRPFQPFQWLPIGRRFNQEYQDQAMFEVRARFWFCDPDRTRGPVQPPAALRRCAHKHLNEISCGRASAGRKHQ